MQGEILEVELSRITVNPFQPRRLFPQVELEELAESIRAVGLIHPPVVRPINGGEVFEIVSGERRFRAAQLAGLKTMPLLVREGGDVFSAEAALIENIQRVDLNAIEISKALQALMDDFGHSQDELAKRVGKKRSTVANYLRLLSLPGKIQESLLAGEISMGHAKAILSLEGFERQLSLHDRVVKEEMSVREAEQAALRWGVVKEKKARIRTEGDCYLQEVQERIQERLGTKVTMEGQGKQGRITIEYYDLDDLDRLLEIFGVCN
jgi:ParB family chromosome partitioning protein